MLIHALYICRQIINISHSGLASPCGTAAVNSSALHYHNASLVNWWSRWLREKLISDKLSG